MSNELHDAELKKLRDFLVRNKRLLKATEKFATDISSLINDLVDPLVEKYDKRADIETFSPEDRVAAETARKLIVILSEWRNSTKASK